MQGVEILTKEKVQLTRPLWEEIFHEDSKAFVDYYYENKAEDNICFVIKDSDYIVAMLHLTPYDICVNTSIDSTVKNTVNSSSEIAISTQKTYYIVGVATKEQYRHKGYMTQMLEAAFAYMKEHGVVFTFLMPANPAIYQPFGFQYIYERFDYELNYELNYELDYESNNQHPSSKVSIQKADSMDCNMLAEFAMNQLPQKYHFFLKREEAYYKKLIKELSSQNGAIYMVYVDETFAGYFMYAVEQEVFIQEVLFKEEYEKTLTCGVHALLRRKEGTKPIIMGKYIGDFIEKDKTVSMIAEGKIQGGFINEIV